MPQPGINSQRVEKHVQAFRPDPDCSTSAGSFVQLNSSCHCESLNTLQTTRITDGLKSAPIESGQEHYFITIVLP